MLEEVRVTDGSQQGVVVIKTDDGVVGVEDVVVTLGCHPVVLRLDVVDRAQQVDFTAVPLLREVNAWRQTRSVGVDYVVGVVDQVISEQVCRVDGCEEISRRRARELRRLRRQRPQLSVASKA